MDEVENTEVTEILNVSLSTSGIDNNDGTIDDEVEEEEEEESDNIVYHMNESAEDAKTDISILSSENAPKDMVFMVPPLLAVRTVSSQDKIAISIQEIQRRIGPPESLSEPLLLGLLRVNKERTAQLRKALLQFGIKELSGRPAVVSSYTKLSEAEAQTVAEDYYFLAAKYMNMRTMNPALVAANGGSKVFYPKAEKTKEILQSILAEIEKRDMSMNLLTHGFSSYILKGVFNILCEIITFKPWEAFFDD